MAQVFISHSTKDDKFIDKLVADLNANNISTFVDHINIPFGSNWAQEIGNALADCQQLIAVLSPDSIESVMCQKEWIHFLDKGKELIPAVHRKTEKSFFVLDGIQWVDLNTPENYDDNISNLINYLTDDEVSQHIEIVSPSEVSQSDVLPAQLHLRYPLSRSPEKHIGIATGNIAEIKGADILVNSENEELDMARPTGSSVSAALNAFSIEYDAYHKSKRPKRPVEEALRDYMSEINEARLPGATVVETIPGSLERNGVRHILHAVAVKPLRGKGYKSVSQVQLGQCVTNTLKKVDELNHDKYSEEVPLTKIVMPIFGSGAGGNTIQKVTPRLIECAFDYLEANKDTKITEVYFLAFSRQNLDDLIEVFNAYVDDLLEGENVNISSL